MKSIVIEVQMKDNVKTVCIKNVNHMLKLQTHLLSVSKILSNKLKVQFNLNECIVKSSDDEVIAIVLREGNLYQMNFIKVYGTYVANLAQSWKK